MKYIGLDGKEYSSIDEVTKANREVKAHPLYVKEMNRRRVANIPGEITREQWVRILGSTEVKKVNSEINEVKPEVKKTYKFQISGLHRSLLKSANRRGIPFDLNGEQIDSLLEKKCYYCGKQSETVITLGDRFEYKECQGVCGTCGEVHDLLGAGMTPWLDSIIDNVK